MLQTWIVKTTIRPCNPYFYGIFTQVHNTLYPAYRCKTETTKQSAVGFRALISAGDTECLEFTKA